MKLRRRLKKLPPEARDRFEAVAGETPEATLKRLLETEPGRTGHSGSRRAPRIGPILDWQVDGDNAALHADLAPSPTRWSRSRAAMATASKPEDFLDSFTAFVRDNINTIAALKLVVQRPRDLTRADLKELRLALDHKGYSEANLRRAWADAKNEDIAASIIGFVRQAALGDPLMPYADRVRAAMQRVSGEPHMDATRRSGG